jgi:hypothetical protein
MADPKQFQSILGKSFFGDETLPKPSTYEKKDEESDQRFVKKDEKKTEKKEEVDEVIEALRQSGVRPEGYQQRNLDNETGGLEAEERKEISSKDFWDERSEEVDKMGSVNAFQKSSIKAMIWRYKKQKLEAKKMGKEAAAAAATMVKKGKGQQQGQDGQGLGQQTTYSQKLRNLRQDRDHEAFGSMGVSNAMFLQDTPNQRGGGRSL